MQETLSMMKEEMESARVETSEKIAALEFENQSTVNLNIAEKEEYEAMIKEIGQLRVSVL